jgi:hypothetical protein
MSYEEAFTLIPWAVTAILAIPMLWLMWQLYQSNRE